MADSLCARTSAHTPTTAPAGASSRTAFVQPPTLSNRASSAPLGEGVQDQHPVPWTPAHHANVNKARPTRLLELTTGPHGQAARFEFAEGWVRTIDLPTEADAYHPVFKDLPIEQRTRLQMHVRQPIEVRPDGTRFRREGLSFCTVTVTERGSQISSCDFDVPAESYTDGQVTGYLCAAELLESLQSDYGPQRGRTQFILKAAGLAAEESTSSPSRRGAAAAFLEVMAAAVGFFGKHAQHQKWLAGRMEQALHQQAWFAADEAKQRAEFVARMQAGRARRRADRATSPAAPSDAKRTHAVRLQRKGVAA